MALFERIIEIMEDEVGESYQHVTEETTFEELNLDSLDMVEIIMAIEDEFGIEISDEDGEKIKSVGDAVAYVADRVED